ncbi:chromosome segregation protein SMC [Pectobacterium odoriferum]|uniref:retron Ec78 anti-phage system effector ATPase PtuA n=1 Tax=Pectobacterium TaxID=122277 RepID=UPI000CD2755C|nr:MULTISPECIES: retron Ec78 anti-phage system effector ATPase PtuA [Pectobacterium]POE07558.1 chromosome segregation protein SMC [Pectobacterium odoriferum]PVY71880.1 putative ATP-binding protein involved in virulence [Pectobacterium versatile]HDL8450350.1 AAA family ATPase [Yersinia enterocolitica]
MEDKKKKPTRTVAEKIEGADKGHLGDMFEVAGWLETGRYSLDTDEHKAAEYYDRIEESLLTKRPFFSSLELVNYKGIKKTINKITFDPYLNVFVGVNGSGKTTIIESVVKASTWLVNGIRNRANGKGIDLVEINNSQDAKDCAITAELTLDEKSIFILDLYKNKNSKGKNRGSLSEFKNLAEMYYLHNNNHQGLTCLPIFCHYSVSRALEIKTDDQRNNNDIIAFNNLDGYNSSFEESKNFKQLLKWMLFCGAQNNGDLDDVKNTLTSLEVKYNTTFEIYNFLADETKEDSQIGLKIRNELDSLRSKIKELKIKLKSADSDIVSIVKEAIYRFMSIDNIRMKVDKTNVSILLDKNGITISATDLSQGEKALFSLVSDISRRLLLLNPEKGIKALEGCGVVIIDEIDLHLHPKWQQEIVGNLRDTFPNIQFILTTHSPQILSTVPSHCIKILRNDENGMLRIDEPEFSLGSESDMILEDIFLVKSRPENIEQVKMLNRYKELVINEMWDTDEAKRLKIDLEKWAGKHDPVMKQLQMDVRLREFRRGKN